MTKTYNLSSTRWAPNFGINFRSPQTMTRDDGFWGCLSQVRETLFSGIRHEGFESYPNGRT